MPTIVEQIAAGTDDAKAIGAPGRPSLTYAGLRALMLRTAARLNALGIGRGDRVAIVLANGPEMAAAFVSLAAAVDHRAAQPGLSRRGVRVLPHRPRRQGDPGRARRGRTVGRGRRAARHRRSCGSMPTPARPAGAFTLDGRGARRRPPAGARRARRHRAGPAHLGHHLAAEDRAAQPRQPRRLGRATSARRWR